MNPEFPRVVEVRHLRDLKTFAFDIVPTSEEAAALARLMGAISLRKMRFAGQLSVAPRGCWLLEGLLGATVVQPCVVTLEPVTTRIDQPVRRLFIPDGGPRAAEVIVQADDDDDETEVLGDRIDLGLVAIEALALAVPAYPRKPGAALEEVFDSAQTPDDATDEPDAPKPFAALAALRAKLGDKA